ncbi:MAG TPA: tripartite tricarboxylate transporter substrate binding protein [Thermodesulfobacteriota bacterium]|nr:tripartite tricarboxylate transporter substrate binding protein [Thermodesulfobacteriota bacterium]
MAMQPRFRTPGRVFWGGLILLALCGGSAGATEKDYPNKMITLINPYAPGGGIDFAYRGIVDILPEYLGQKIVVSHKPGAVGSIGTAAAAKAKPDGYTLLAGSTSHVNLVPATRKVPYTPADFVSVGTFAKAISVLSVEKDAPWKTLAEFVADAKKNPGKYKFSTIGLMSAHHFCTELFMRAAGIQMVHIPYNSDTLAITATLGGHSHVCQTTVQPTLPHLQSGALRALAVSDVTRYPYLPDVPTFKELGYNVEMIIWFGMLAPKGTPKEVIDRLYAAQKKAFDENKLQPIIEKIGMIPFLTSPQEMDRIVQENQERFTRIAKEANLEVK